jgi:hypothetical protein
MLWPSISIKAVANRLIDLLPAVMLFSTLAIVVPLLFHAVSAAPTARTATCPDAKVWGASDPSVTWVIVGYERDLRLTDPNNPAFDTEYQLLSNCPSGGGTVSWWVEVRDSTLFANTFDV